MKFIQILILLFTTQIYLNGQKVISKDQWQYDLDYLGQKLEERHANLYHTYDKQRFWKDINELKVLSNSISDKELLIRISELLAKVGDAHTFLDFRNQRNWEYKRIPLEVNYFNDGLYVIGSNVNLKHLIGSKISAINSHPIDTIIKRVEYVGYNENVFTRLISVSRFIIYPDVLKRFGFATNVNSVDVEFEKRNKSTITEIIPIAQDSIKWVFAHNGDGQRYPMTYQQTDSIFWFGYEQKSQLLYIQINKCRENETHQFETLSEDILKITSEKRPKKLVIDLRRNVGGNSQLTYPLLYALTKYEKDVPEGQIFIIIGRWTLSASIVLSVEIGKFCNPIFIGEPTGAAPNLFGENSYPLTLPNSEIEISYSSEWFQPAGPFIDDPWIAPNIYLPIHSSQYFNLEEPILDRIRSYSKDTLSFSERVYNLAMHDSIEEAIQFYESFKAQPENSFQNTMTSIRRMANQLGRNGKLEYCLVFHQLNTRDNANSAHAMLSLAEHISDIRGADIAKPYYVKASNLLKTDKSLNNYLKHYFEDYLNNTLNP